MRNAIKKSHRNQRQKVFSNAEIPKKELFAKNSTHDTGIVKKRIIKYNLLPYQCAMCGRGPEWNGKELVLVLDHINGVNNDHRLENLRFLCPNCNSQTATFAGKHIPKPRKEYWCKECGKSITRFSKTGLCGVCASKSLRKVERPPRAELEQLVEEHGFSAVGRMFGVSDNAIRKWLS